MVELMRADAYPGSELVIEEKLSPGSNYDRTIVSYLSEGLKDLRVSDGTQGEKPATGWPMIFKLWLHPASAVPQQSERYIAYTDAFSAKRLYALRPDYRGRGHGFSKESLANSYASPAYTVDVLNAMASVMAHLDADPNRVGMWGHSMGGSITLRAMVVTDTIKAGVIWGRRDGALSDDHPAMGRTVGRSPTIERHRTLAWRITRCWRRGSWVGLPWCSTLPCCWLRAT